MSSPRVYFLFVPALLLTVTEKMERAKFLMTFPRKRQRQYIRDVARRVYHKHGNDIEACRAACREEMVVGSILISILIGVAVQLAVKLIMKWIENRQKDPPMYALPGDLDY